MNTKNVPTASAFRSMYSNNCWLIAKFELVRLFFTRRGMVFLAAFAFIWFFIYHYIIVDAASLMMKSDLQDVINATLGNIGGEQLAKLPVAELVMYWLLAIFIFPIFSLFIAADQTASDKERGTLRFLTLRTSRDSILLGRFFGQVMIISILIIATLAAALTIAIWRDASLSLTALIASITIFLGLLLTNLPFIALMTLCSSVSKSARSSSFLSIIILGISSILISLLTYYLPALSFLADWTLGANLFQQVNYAGLAMFSHGAIPLIQTALLLIVAKVIFSRGTL